MGDMPVDPELVPSPDSFSSLSINGSSGLFPTTLIDMSRLGGPNPTSSLTREQLKIVRIIALVSSSITIIASVIVLCWFLRMKRNFRRQLVMILILCDSFKSLWSFIFPAVALANTTVATTSNFCQASGFFFAAGIEAADLCILFIAIHAAISIFLPRTGPAGKSGLYRWRHSVYTTIIILPILMAALAFTNSAPAYVAQTTWCYLPVRPFWYRLALAWIPRYIIMLTITGLYLAIYIYVKVTFRAYRARFRTSEFDTDATQPSQMDTTRQTMTDRRGSVLSVFGATFKIPGIIGKTEKVREEDVGLDPVTARIRRLSEAEPQDDAEAAGGPGQILDIEKGAQSPTSVPEFPMSKELHPELVDDQRRGTGSSTHDSTSRMLQQNPRSMLSGAPNETEEELRKRQYAIQRQLRFLFIYPCVYVLIWLIPLINHSLQYYDRLAEHPSFPLVCISAIAVPIQGAIDCLLFSLREKPWRLVRKQTKQPWISWIMGKPWDEPADEDVNIEAMTEGQRHAYLRREREKAENEEAKRERVEKKRKAKMTRKGSMTWWDTFERANMSGTAVSRQSSQDGEASGTDGGPGRMDSLAVPSGGGLPIMSPDGRVLRRNSSFGSAFGSLGRKRSRSTSELWRNFSFSDATGRQGSITANRKQSSAGVVEPMPAPEPIAAIEEEQPHGHESDDGSISPSDVGPDENPVGSTSASTDMPDEGLMMKGLPVLPRK